MGAEAETIRRDHGTVRVQGDGRYELVADVRDWAPLVNAWGVRFYGNDAGQAQGRFDATKEEEDAPKKEAGV